MQTARLLWEMGKPRIMLLLCCMTLCGALLAPSPSLFRSLAAAAVVGLLWLGTALINDLADLAIDQASNPNRPLPSGRLRPGIALAWGIGAQTTALLLTVALGSRSAIALTLCGLFLGNVYSVPPFRLRRNGPAANLIIGAGVGCAVLGGQLAHGRITSGGLVAGLVLGLGAAAVSLVKDFKDVAGDRAQGVRTLPVWLGWGPAVRINLYATAAAYGLLLLATVHQVGLLYPLTLLVGCLAITALLLLRGLLRSVSPRRARTVHQQAMLLFMGVSLCYALAQWLARCR